jgi:hypothetical protein
MKTTILSITQDPTYPFQETIYRVENARGVMFIRETLYTGHCVENYTAEELKPTFELLKGTEEVKPSKHLLWFAIAASIGVEDSHPLSKAQRNPELKPREWQGR